MDDAGNARIKLLLAWDEASINCRLNVVVVAQWGEKRCGMFDKLRVFDN